MAVAQHGPFLTANNDRYCRPIVHPWSSYQLHDCKAIGDLELCDLFFRITQRWDLGSAICMLLTGSLMKN